jgi:hypothetical protein
MVGYRYISSEQAVEVGTTLAPSHDWIGDEPTDVLLDGTCVFDSLAACKRYAQWSRGVICAVEGDRVRNDGTGIIAGEMLLANAVVTAIICDAGNGR